MCSCDYLTLAVNICDRYVNPFIQLVIPSHINSFFLLSLAEGIFRAHLLELEKENSQANGVSIY